MEFDFERFTLRAKLAYRRIENSLYCLDDVLEIFKYYFETYELVKGQTHPMISIEQIVSIIDKMPFVLDDNYSSRTMVDINPEDYKVIIDQHFITKYRKCDYNINHFFSGSIRDMRYYETLY